MSIKKIIVPLILIFLILFIVTLSLNLYISYIKFNDNDKDYIRSKVKIAISEYENEWKIKFQFINTQKIKTYILNKSTDIASEFANVDFFLLFSTDGKVLFKKDPSSNQEFDLNVIPFDDVLSNISEGNDRQITHVTSSFKNINNNFVWLSAGYIYDVNKPIGILIIGELINKKTYFLNKILKETNNPNSIFIVNKSALVPIASNLQDINSISISENKGNFYLLSNDGTKYNLIDVPLNSNSKSIDNIGTILIQGDRVQSLFFNSENLLTVSVILFISLIGLIVFLFIYNNSLLRPLGDFKKLLLNVQNGDLSLNQYNNLGKNVKNNEVNALISDFKNVIKSAKETSDRMKREIDNWTTINEINKIISPVLEPHLMSHLIMEKFLLVSSALYCDIMLLNESSGELENQIIGGTSNKPLNPKTIDTAKSLVPTVIKSGQPCIENNIEYVENGITKRDKLIILPLNAHSKTIGSITLYNKSDGSDFSNSEQELLLTLAEQAAISIDNSNIYKNIQDKERIKKELQISQEIQEKLIPKDTPKLHGIKLSSKIIRGSNSKGSYYDFIENKIDKNAGKYGIVIAETKTMDTKITSAEIGLIITMIRTALRAVSYIEELSPSKVLTGLNNIINRDIERGNVLQILYGVWNGRDKNFIYSTIGTSSGSEQKIGFIYHKGSNKIELIKSGKGVMTPKLSTINEYSVKLFGGDILILFTQGLIETENLKGEKLGFERVSEIVSKHSNLNPEELVEQIINTADKFRGSTIPKEDIILIVGKSEIG